MIEPHLIALAASTGLNVEAARDLYRLEVERLGRNAHIVDFVPLLASKRLERALRERRSRKQPSPAPRPEEPLSPVSVPGPAANARASEAAVTRSGSAAAVWTREELEAFERTLTLAELTRDDAPRCREIVELLKAARDDPKRFARFGDDERAAVILLIDRFDGFC